VNEPQPAGPVIAVIEIERLTGPHQQPTPRARLPVGVPHRGPTQGLMVTPQRLTASTPPMQLC
jgi:hypothetical protein